MDEERWFPRDTPILPIFNELGSGTGNGYTSGVAKVFDRTLVLNSYGIPLKLDTMSYNFSGDWYFGKENLVYNDCLDDGYGARQGSYMRGKLGWWEEDKIIQLMDYMGKFSQQDKEQVLRWVVRAKYLEVVRLAIGGSHHYDLEGNADDFNPKDIVKTVRSNFDCICQQRGVKGLEFNEQEVEKYLELSYRNWKALAELSTN